MKRRLTLACGLYDRTMLLHCGMVSPEGIDLNVVHMEPRELFRRQARHAEFDVAEFPFGTHVLTTAKGISKHIAIPVFPTRKFRHADIYVNVDSGISGPVDLAGKRIGAVGYQQTAGIWIRGILHQEYGVDLASVEWVFGSLNESREHEERIDITMPSELRYSWISEGESLDGMLRNGDIDAYIGAATPNSYRTGYPTVARLFPNYWDEEREFFSRTRIFPIMHTVAIRRDVCEEDPWVAVSLYKAFVEAQAASRPLAERGGTLFCALPWLQHHFEERDAWLGGDPFVYGMEPNRHVIEQFIEYELRQGLIDESIAVEALFAPETHAVAATTAS